MGTSRLWYFLLALPLAGCLTVGPDYKPPELDAPDAWHQDLAEPLQTAHVDLDHWWTAFGDPVLNDLVDQAREANRDLAAITARRDAAYARVSRERGALFPDLVGSGDYTRTRFAEEVNLAPPIRRSDEWGFGASSFWEIDLFGRIRRSVEAADAQYGANVENTRDALAAITADVVASYVEIRTLSERLRYATENAELQRGTMELVQSRKESGLVPDLDVSQAESNLATTEALIPSLQLAIEQNLNLLSLLLGEAPGSVDRLRDQAVGLPKPPATIAVGLPADALRRRPDVRRAERQLAAATALVGVATADLYPRFSLSGFLGRSAENTANLSSSDNTTYTVQPGFAWNLFAGGSIRAEIRAREAEMAAAMADYESAVLNALRETEDALAAFRLLREREAALTRAVNAGQRSVDQVEVQYRSGLIDFQNVLDTQRALTGLQDDRASTAGDAVQALVSLYRAIGAGWTTGEKKTETK
ncbi:MAG: efflux transporter outer membrane subunit [Planctomycetota bacterium]|jgi:NodT family efflux transporter outer membrane factor (OMF) lipoprotein